jgi:uncharacterized protein
MENHINIQIVYALKDMQKVLELKVKQGTTILQAFTASKIADDYKEIDLNNLSLGVYGKVKPLDYILQEDDRIEIYRELLVTKKVEKSNSLKVEI